MQNNIFALDGTYYDVIIPEGGIKRDAEILDGEGAGRSKPGGMTFDTIGTYYNYTITILRSNSNLADYDAVHKVLRSAKNRKHFITVPFDQGSITYIIYVASISDELKFTRDGKNYWDGMTIKCTAVDPNERA